MRKIIVLMLLTLAFVPLGTARAEWRKTNTELIELNRKLKGKVLDYTANHGCDNRIWSRMLGQRRDLYVYLPPNFDPSRRYPIVILLHGLGQDEQVLLGLAPLLDHSIYVGDLPPLIVAAPDGTVNGVPDSHKPATFWLNSNQGDFEDYVLTDVWNFVASTFPLRSEREAHVLAGISMGGYAAFSLALRHRYCFGTVIGIHPPLNMRWMDECGNYMARFNPYHWGWRTNFDAPGEVVGRFGLYPVRVGQLIRPLFASSEEAIVEISRYNPIELVERTCLRNGELQMYVGYGAHDEFNCTAQVESFLYLCKFKRIYVGVGYDADGHHDLRTAYRLWPGIVTWLKPRLEVVELATPAPVCQAPNVTRRVPAQVQMPVQAQMLPPPAPAFQPPPQPVTSTWTAPRFGSAADSSGVVSRPFEVPGSTTLPDTLPPPPSPSAATPSSPRITPPSRSDLGPAAPSGLPYGPYDAQPPTPPGAPSAK